MRCGKWVVYRENKIGSELIIVEDGEGYMGTHYIILLAFYMPKIF